MFIQFSTIVCIVYLTGLFFMNNSYCDSAQFQNDRDNKDIKNYSLWSIVETRKPKIKDTDIIQYGGKHSKIRRRRKKLHKKYRKYILPLLMAYKLKYLALIPLLVGGLVLLVGSTGLAGFFFALFAAVLGLKSQPKD